VLTRDGSINQKRWGTDEIGGATCRPPTAEAITSSSPTPGKHVHPSWGHNRHPVVVFEARPWRSDSEVAKPVREGDHSVRRVCRSNVFRASSTAILLRRLGIPSGVVWMRNRSEIEIVDVLEIVGVTSK
jgi:hypothetical protein